MEISISNRTSFSPSLKNEESWANESKFVLYAPDTTEYFNMKIGSW